VCEMRAAPTRWLFTRDRSFFTPRPYPLTDCVWRWGCMSSHFMAKSALQLYKGPSPNKQFHTTHVLLLPTAHCRLIWKVTALVKTPLRHDTLAEKSVNKILKCFSISVGHCTCILVVGRGYIYRRRGNLNSRDLNFWRIDYKDHPHRLLYREPCCML
jgi:hypothetical protein